MFKELASICATATLLMSISADEKTGLMTINVTPKPKKDADEPALSKPLTLTATPEEFDAGFVNALQSFQAKRVSLAEQVEATAEVLAAAKAEQSARAAKAKKPATAPAKTTTKPSATGSGGEADPDPEDEDDAGGDSTGSDQSASVAPVSTDPAPSLFG
jgi:PRTRC genetic system protein E